MTNLILAVLVATFASEKLLDRRPGPEEITAMLAVPGQSKLLLAWADGTLSCVESATGEELWNSWLPAEAACRGDLTVMGGRAPVLLSHYADKENDEYRRFLLVLDVAAEQPPRKVRLGKLGEGMYRIVAADEGHICIHHNGNDILYDCGIDGVVRCAMDVETCLIGAVLLPQSAPLLVSFHSDRSVIAAQLCGNRQWSKRREFLEPVGRIGSTVVAVAPSERFVIGLRADDGAEVWRYPYPESDQFKRLFTDGTLVFTSKSGVKLVRLSTDSRPERVNIIDYDGDVDVVAVGSGQYIACMSRFSLQEDNVLRRRGTKVSLFDVSNGKEAYAWTPVKPVVPTSRAAGDWPKVYRKAAQGDRICFDTAFLQTCPLEPDDDWFQEHYAKIEYLCLLRDERVVEAVVRCLGSPYVAHVEAGCDYDDLRSPAWLVFDEYNENDKWPFLRSLCSLPVSGRIRVMQYYDHIDPPGWDQVRSDMLRQDQALREAYVGSHPSQHSTEPLQKGR